MSSIKTLVLRAQTTLISNVHVRVAYVVKFLHDLQSPYNLRKQAEMCKTKGSVVSEKTVYNLCKLCIKLHFTLIQVYVLNFQLVMFLVQLFFKHNRAVE